MGGLLTDTLALAHIKEAGLAKMASVELNLGLTQLYKKHQVEFHCTQLFYVQQRMRKSLNRRFLVSTPRSVQFLSVIMKGVFYVFDMCKFYTFPYSWSCTILSDVPERLRDLSGYSGLKSSPCFFFLFVFSKMGFLEFS